MPDQIIIDPATGRRVRISSDRELTPQEIQRELGLTASRSSNPSFVPGGEISTALPGGGMVRVQIGGRGSEIEPTPSRVAAPVAPRLKLADYTPGPGDVKAAERRETPAPSHLSTFVPDAKVARPGESFGDTRTFKPAQATNINTGRVVDVAQNIREKKQKAPTLLGQVGNAAVGIPAGLIEMGARASELALSSFLPGAAGRLTENANKLTDMAVEQIPFNKQLTAGGRALMEGKENDQILGDMKTSLADDWKNDPVSVLMNAWQVATPLAKGSVKGGRALAESPKGQAALSRAAQTARKVDWDAVESKGLELLGAKRGGNLYSAADGGASIALAGLAHIGAAKVAKRGLKDFDSWAASMKKDGRIDDLDARGILNDHLKDIHRESVLLAENGLAGKSLVSPEDVPLLGRSIARASGMVGPNEKPLQGLFFSGDRSRSVVGDPARRSGPLMGWHPDQEGLAWASAQDVTARQFENRAREAQAINPPGSPTPGIVSVGKYGQNVNSSQTIQTVLNGIDRGLRDGLIDEERAKHFVDVIASAVGGARGVPLPDYTFSEFYQHWPQIIRQVKERDAAMAALMRPSVSNMLRKGGVSTEHAIHIETMPSLVDDPTSADWRGAEPSGGSAVSLLDMYGRPMVQRPEGGNPGYPFEIPSSLEGVFPRTPNILEYLKDHTGNTTAGAQRSMGIGPRIAPVADNISQLFDLYGVLDDIGAKTKSGRGSYPAEGTGIEVRSSGGGQGGAPEALGRAGLRYENDSLAGDGNGQSGAAVRGAGESGGQFTLGALGGGLVPSKADVSDFAGQLKDVLSGGKKRDFNYLDRFRSPLSVNDGQGNSLIQGSYERIAGSLGKQASDVLRRMQLAIDEGASTKPAAVRSAKKSLESLYIPLESAGFPGLVEELKNHIAAIESEYYRQASKRSRDKSLTEDERQVAGVMASKLEGAPKPYEVALGRVVDAATGGKVADPQFALRGVVDRALQVNSILKLKYNVKSSAVNLTQPLETLWPRVKSADMAKIVAESLKPSTRKRLQEAGVIDGPTKLEELGGGRVFVDPEISALVDMDEELMALASAIESDWFVRQDAGELPKPEKPAPVRVPLTTKEKLAQASPFSAASGQNRMIGYLYGEMEAKRQGITDPVAIHRNGLSWAEVVEFDNSIYNMPPVMRDTMARLLLQYKGFTVKSLENLGDLVASAKTPQERAARLTKWSAQKVGVGGIKALPGASAAGLAAVYFGARQMAKDQGASDEDAQKIAEAAYFGAPALLGLDLSSSVTTLDEPFGNTTSEQAVNFLAGPTVGSALTLGQMKREGKSALEMAGRISPYVRQGQAISDMVTGKGEVQVPRSKSAPRGSRLATMAENVIKALPAPLSTSSAARLEREDLDGLQKRLTDLSMELIKDKIAKLPKSQQAMARFRIERATKQVKDRNSAIKAIEVLQKKVNGQAPATPGMFATPKPAGSRLDSYRG